MSGRVQAEEERDRAGRGGLSLIFGGVNAIWLISKERDGVGGGGGERVGWMNSP